MLGASFLRLAPQFAYRSFTVGSTLRVVEKPNPALYFVRSGLAADIVRTTEGNSVVASIVGREGFIGLPLWLGGPANESEWLWLVPGEAWRVPLAIFDREAAPAVDRFTAAQLHAGRLAAACHLLHTVEQRIARYLLEIAERGGIDELVATHEQLTAMVGVTRPRISAALDHLERQGGIYRGRGRILIRNIQSLTDIACDCVRFAREAHDRLNLPWSPPKRVAR